MLKSRFKKFVPFSLGAILLIAALSSALAQEDDHMPLFTLYGDGPVIEHGRLGEWDSVYNDAGAVIYHDGQFHMLRNGLQSLANGGASIGYLTSDDGLNWTEVSEDPVMSTADVPYTDVTAQVGSILVDADGTWIMYLHVLDTANFPYSGGSIGRATAPDPLGPWTPDPEPILLPGADGEWDDLQVSHSRVVRTEDGYRMYYSGYSQRQTMAIGLAFSDDGLTWTKYDIPDTTEAPYEDSDPVLVATEDWEFDDLHHPSVVQAPDGWVMTYRTPGDSGNVGFEVGLGLATSEDGIHWTKYAGNPIFVPSDLPGGRWIWYSTLAYHDGTYYLYMEGSTQRQLGGITDVYATTYEGSLPPTE